MPDENCSRQEFFEWLHTCPCGEWAIIEDQDGEFTVRFYFDEEEEAP